jgi:hypothetical protein
MMARASAAAQVCYALAVTRAAGFLVLCSAVLVGILYSASKVPASTPGRVSPGAAAVLGAKTRSTTHRPPPPAGPRGTWLALVYGGNGQGEIEPCG